MYTNNASPAGTLIRPLLPTPSPVYTNPEIYFDEKPGQRSTLPQGFDAPPAAFPYPVATRQRHRLHAQPDRGNFAQLSGTWRTSSGQVAHVTDRTVHFTFPDGTLLPPARELTLSPSGEINLMGVNLAQSSPTCVVWDDNDVWTSVQDALPPAPRGVAPSPNNVSHGLSSAPSDHSSSGVSAFNNTRSLLGPGPGPGHGHAPHVHYGHGRLHPPSGAAGQHLGNSGSGRYPSNPSAVRRTGSGAGRGYGSGEKSLDWATQEEVQRRLSNFRFGDQDQNQKNRVTIGLRTPSLAPPPSQDAPLKNPNDQLTPPPPTTKRRHATYSSHEDETSRRMSSASPHLLARSGLTYLRYEGRKGRMKIKKVTRALMCGCCKSNVTGNEYVDIEGDEGAHPVVDPNGVLLMTEDVKRYIARIRTVLTEQPTPEMYEIHASVVYSAFKQFPEVRKFRKSTRWDIILEATKGRDKGLQSAFKAVSEELGEPKIAPSIQESVKLCELWWAVDEDADGTLDFKEIRQLLSLLNVSMKPSIVKSRLKQFDRDGNMRLDFEEFTVFYNWLRQRFELKVVYENILASNTPDAPFSSKLQLFLKQSQKEDVSDVGCVQLVKEWIHQGITTPGVSETGKVEWDLQAFSRYLMSAHNTWFCPASRKKTMSLTHPIAHYYVNSSHNTYLTGDQLMSDSSAGMYTYTLLTGCRCVEVDCWDGKNGEPIVYHGNTKTSKVSFQSVIEAIHADAFTVSDLPLVISLEVHTCEAQQERMAHIMKQVFGSSLHPAIAPREDGTVMSPEYREKYHDKYTPQSLRKRILLKGPMLSNDVLAELDPKEESRGDDHAVSQTESAPASKKKVTVARGLSDIIFFRNTKLRPGGPQAHCGGLGRVYECTSLSELAAEKLLKDRETQRALATMNKTTMTRVYPKGARVDSTNLFPYEWVYGSQLVSFNFQTPDFSMRLNRAFFQQNGNCGYVLKPERLRRQDLDPLKPAAGPKLLVLSVISAGNLPKPNMQHKGEIIDPFVMVMVTGAPEDDTQKKPVRTKMIDDNGFNPVWNETFRMKIHDPETAILTIRVMESDKVGWDDFIGEASCPLTCLRQGFRSVPLLDAQSRSQEGTFVLCKFEILDS
eukprot:Rhum_TRINITY_DN25005_c0_g1::Rhum_TRINITY_DN25005_c0_g1_i1::g.180921::m.180921/K05857/PLCD; phosphatidylinositol phospholipase C, delta